MATTAFEMLLSAQFSELNTGQCHTLMEEFRRKACENEMDIIDRAIAEDTYVRIIASKGLFYYLSLLSDRPSQLRPYAIVIVPSCTADDTIERSMLSNELMVVAMDVDTAELSYNELAAIECIKDHPDEGPTIELRVTKACSFFPQNAFACRLDSLDSDAMRGKAGVLFALHTMSISDDGTADATLDALNKRFLCLVARALHPEAHEALKK